MNRTMLMDIIRIFSSSITWYEGKGSDNFEIVLDPVSNFVQIMESLNEAALKTDQTINW